MLKIGSLVLLWLSFLALWEECVKEWVFGVAVVVIFKHKSARKVKTVTHENSAFKTNNFLNIGIKST